MASQGLTLYRAEEAHLIIFDRHPAKPWEEKIFTRKQEHLGLSISLWGM
jgi:hypothetical protein